MITRSDAEELQLLASSLKFVEEETVEDLLHALATAYRRDPAGVKLAFKVLGITPTGEPTYTSEDTVEKQMSDNNANQRRRLEFAKWVAFNQPDRIVGGWFHTWSGHPDVHAIVEADDGQVFMVEPKRIRFIKSEIPPELEHLIKK